MTPAGRAPPVGGGGGIVPGPHGLTGRPRAAPLKIARGATPPAGKVIPRWLEEPQSTPGVATRKKNRVVRLPLLSASQKFAQLQTGKDRAHGAFSDSPLPEPHGRSSARAPEGGTRAKNQERGTQSVIAGEHAPPRTTWKEVGTRPRRRRKGSKGLIGATLVSVAPIHLSCVFKPSAFPTFGGPPKVQKGQSGIERCEHLSRPVLIAPGLRAPVYNGKYSPHWPGWGVFILYTRGLELFSPPL